MQLAALPSFQLTLSAVKYSVSERIKAPDAKANPLQHLRFVIAAPIYLLE